MDILVRQTSVLPWLAKTDHREHRVTQRNPTETISNPPSIPPWGSPLEPCALCG